MSPIASAAVTVRRLLVKRPWIYWLLVVVAALGAAASMLDRADRVDAARDSWGDVRIVQVAAVDHRPGDRLQVESRAVPQAMVAETTADDIAGFVARQHIAAGEIIHSVDLAAPAGPQAMTPSGWLAVPIIESPRSGAQLGDRVHIVSDGIVLSVDGLVAGHHDDTTLIAVPASDAVVVAAGAGGGDLSLLLVP